MFVDLSVKPPTGPSSAVVPPEPPELPHPALWRASQLGGGRAAVTATGFAALDDELPGGGWPHRTLTELLLPHPGLGEMRLLAPALAAITGQAADGRCVMLFSPPAALGGWTLAQLGVDAHQLLLVHGRDGPALRRLGPGADLLWALEQALKCGHVGAVLAWLPSRLKADALRRLQLAAQSHDGPAFLLRGIEARLQPSAASLRLSLQACGIDEIALRVLKRRGPALPQPLRLSLVPILSERQRRRAQARRAALVPRPAAGAVARPGPAAPHESAQAGPVAVLPAA